MTASNQEALDQEVNQAAAESINYQMIDKKGNCYDIDETVAEIIHEAFKRIFENCNLNDFIRAASQEILSAHGTNIEITGNLGDIIIEELPGAYINNVERLKVVLGKRFGDLVKDDEIATTALIDIATDADDPLAPEVRGCITIKKIINIQWLPGGFRQDFSCIDGDQNRMNTRHQAGFKRDYGHGTEKKKNR